MGDKLVKMVKFLIIVFLAISLEVESKPTDSPIVEKELYKLHVDPLVNKARIFEITGDGSSFTLKDSYIGKPPIRTLKTTHLVTKRDKYILRFRDADNKVLMSLGIGDPFTAHAQHLGYEDGEQFTFQVGRQDISAAIPMQINPSSITIEKRYGYEVSQQIATITLDIE